MELGHLTLASLHSQPILLVIYEMKIDSQHPKELTLRTFNELVHLNHPLSQSISCILKVSVAVTHDFIRPDFHTSISHCLDPAKEKNPTLKHSTRLLCIPLQRYGISSLRNITPLLPTGSFLIDLQGILETQQSKLYSQVCCDVIYVQYVESVDYMCKQHRHSNYYMLHSWQGKSSANGVQCSVNNAIN